MFDIRPFLKSFCKHAATQFKNQFQYVDENLYLFNQLGDMFLFLMTRSNEIIKKINTNDMNLGEIYGLLGKNEQLGFASYAIIKENYFAFGSTMLAPKYTVFAEFVNMIFKALNLRDIELGLEPFLHQATRADILKIPFLGKTIIEIQKENSFAQDILEFVGADVQDVHDVDSFEIVIKPKRKQNIKNVVAKFIGSIADDGLQRMVVKAKTELQDHLSDFYLMGQGAISDLVDSKDESQIYNLFSKRMETNDLLKVKIGEFRDDERFEKTELKNLSGFNDPDAWPDIVCHIQQDDPS